MKNVRVATFTTTTKGLFAQWLTLTASLHNLTGREQELLSLLLYQHHEISKDIKNEKLVWKLVFDYETKLAIREEMGIKDYDLQNLISRLRKKKAIKGKRVNPSFIPILTKDVSNYKIVFNINIQDG